MMIDTKKAEGSDAISRLRQAHDNLDDVLLAS